MDSNTTNVSSIPADAREKVTARYDKNGKKRAEYYVGKELVGIREFFPTGEPESEWPIKNGVQHGMYYRWDDPGKLLNCEPFENGLAHGTAYQWARDGTLIGSYTMHHGTGIDLWWQDWMDGSITLTEVCYYQGGVRHGFQWSPRTDTSLWGELHWYQGELHGIERQWNSKGRLRRGYPRYYVHGERVTKRQYMKACATDPTLPPFRVDDNAPQRVYPPEVAMHVRPRG